MKRTTASKPRKNPKTRAAKAKRKAVRRKPVMRHSRET
jgi:hypothetical protein